MENAYPDSVVVVDDPVLNHLLELLFRHTESRMNLPQRHLKVLSVDSQVVDIVRDTCHGPNLDMSIERKTRRALD